ncbi:MAG: NusG domain II-containing protein [Firmicutes bacterium]|jgi:hypothetical protein|nr:NusG domain II-containing protein [Bacillota bacterium]
MIKKADVLLFFIILIFGACISWWSLSENQPGQRVVITVEGETYGTYSLNQDQQIVIEKHGHQNHITIKDGQVSMSFSDCKNQVCVNSGAISETKDTIVCLPNKVLIEIQSKQGGEPDVITG